MRLTWHHWPAALAASLALLKLSGAVGLSWGMVLMLWLVAWAFVWSVGMLLFVVVIGSIR